MKKIRTMKNVLQTMSSMILMLLLSATTLKANDEGPRSPAIVGRWDITINMNGKALPSWLEVHNSGTHTLVGSFVGTGGSARPVSVVQFNDGKVSFSIPPQWEQGNGDLSFEANLQGDSLSGTITFPDGKSFPCSAVRAPSLKDEKSPVWGKPITLFDGKDLNGWHALGENQWVVADGTLKSPHSGANLVTDQTFTDFKLHIEFRYPKESNSGVYLRGRYEVQVEDEEDVSPVQDRLGAVYGFIEPSDNAAKSAGEWQSYDITLAGRMVTVVLNGKTVICHREIPGITGGAINSREGEPGPLLIQGDHGPIEYRNIVLTPAK
jgi:hypothetical protein